MSIYIITPFGLKLHCGTIAQSTMQSVKPLYPAKIGLNGHYIPDFEQPRFKQKSLHNPLHCITFEFLEESDIAEIK